MFHRLYFFIFLFSVFSGFILAGCDQAIDARYDGLEVVDLEEVEVIEIGDDPASEGGGDVARPQPRPSAVTASLPLDVAGDIAGDNNLENNPEPSDENLAQSRENTDANARAESGAESDVEAQARAAAQREAAARLAAAESARRAQEAEIARQEAQAAAARRTEQTAQTEQASEQAGTTTATPAPSSGSTAQTTVTSGASDATSRLSGAAQLDAQYRANGFDLSLVMAGQPVPNLIVQSMPSDMAALGVQNRALMKDVFIKIVLPLCLRANARVGEERALLLSIPQDLLADDLRLSSHRGARSLAAKYQESTLETLLVRLAPIPPSLCLAQAIHDSDWGRSDAVKGQNALFGTWSRDVNDPAVLVPYRGRSDVARDRIQFDDLAAAVDAYMLFVNRHEDLAAFRTRRAEETSIGQIFSGRTASLFMDGFRPLEPTYRDRLLRLIDENDLDQFDLAKLSGAPRAIAVN